MLRFYLGSIQSVVKVLLRLYSFLADLQTLRGKLEAKAEAGSGVWGGSRSGGGGRRGGGGRDYAAAEQVLVPAALSLRPHILVASLWLKASCI